VEDVADEPRRRTNEGADLRERACVSRRDGRAHVHVMPHVCQRCPDFEETRLYATISDPGLTAKPSAAPELGALRAALAGRNLPAICSGF